MLFPICRNCGLNHSPLVRCEFVANSVANNPDNWNVDNGVVANKVKDRHKDKVGRRIYMRELMRRRRAK